MGALWLPSDDELVVAQREPNLLVPGRKPVGDVVPTSDHLISALIVQPGRESIDLCGNQWLIAGNPTYSHYAGGGDDAPHYLQLGSTSNYLYTTAPRLRDLPTTSQFTFAIIAVNNTSSNSSPAPFGWSGADDVFFYQARPSLSGRNGVFWRDIGGSVLASAGDSTLYKTTISHITARVVSGTIYLDKYVNGVYVESHSASAAGIGPFTQLEFGRWETQAIAIAGSGGPVGLFLWDVALSAPAIQDHAASWWSVTRPANQSPFLISIPGGGGAAYDETFSASASSAFTLSDSWALNYAETFGASAASGAELTDSYQTPSANYDETFAASAASGAELADAWSLDYSETFAATAASGATLTDAWLLNYAETFAAASAAAFTLTDAWALDYAETFAASAASGCDLAHSYAAGNNYAETFAASSVSVATLTHAYSVQYAETFAAQALADCTLVAAWALDYAETFAASSATDCVLTDAYGTPAPGAFDETFAAAAVSACDLTHAFSTPAAIGRVINPTLAASGVPARTLKGLKLIN